LETTLVSVLQHRPDDCEILAVVNTPYDDPYDLKDEVRFIDAPAGSRYVDCANLGIRASAAPIVHLLAAGLEVAEGWADAALARFADPAVAAVTPLVCDAADPDRLLSAGVGFSRGGRPTIRATIHGTAKADSGSSATGIFPTARAAFYRRAALESLGGEFPVGLGDELCAVDLALGLQYAGYRAALEEESRILSSASAAAALGGKGFGYGLAAERLFWRNLPASGWLAAVALHPWTVAGEVLRSLPRLELFGQMLGRAVAIFSAGSYRTRHQQLRAARAEFAERGSRPNALPPQLRIDRGHPQSRPARPSDVRLRRA